MNQQKNSTQSNSPKFPWWKATTVYQIYPRSFMDSNKDGIGDLRGIINKLDYLKELGIETIWFSPFYTSPQADFGYDISDYRNIAPEYGDLETCERLVEEIHKRGIKVIFDMVMNHTSDEHPWFQESRANLTNPKRNWYIWRDGKEPEGKKPPTNWRSHLGTRGWHHDKDTDQWYWSSFLECQPDLNYRNPDVKKEMLDTVRFWLEKGVDGFRLDIIHAVYQDEKFRDNPFMLTLMGSEKKEGQFFHSTKYTIHHPDTFEFMTELRAVLNEFANPPRYLVGEVMGPLNTIRKYCTSSLGEDFTNDRLNTVFLFSARDTAFKANAFRKTIELYESKFPEPLTPTWVFSNHDIIRKISALGNNVEKAKLLAALQLTMRGIPFIYYGEEIGMRQNNIPLEDSQDAVAFRFQKFPKFLQKLIVKMTGEAVHRDNCRTPMQWSGAPNAGYCSKYIDPWLPFNENYEECNVDFAQRDPDSLWQTYKRFLTYRKSIPALHLGSIELLPADQVPSGILAYYRKTEVKDASTYFILLNFQKREMVIPYPDELQSTILELVTSTTILTKILNNKQEKNLILSPYEGVILKLV